MNFQKRKPIRSKKITDAANGESCTWPGCGLCDGTVVAAHSNELGDGKGTSQKSDDLFVAFLCIGHHDVYDGRKPTYYLSVADRQECFHQAMKKTQRRIWERGIIGILKST